MTNKRRHRRVPLAASAAIQYVHGEVTERLRALIADISLSGIGVYADRSIREGTELSIEVTFISTEGLTATAFMRGECVYAREMGGVYFIGIEFDEEVDPAKQPSLYSHLQKILGWD